jgi:Peptidase A4 family
MRTVVGLTAGLTAALGFAPPALAVTAPVTSAQSNVFAGYNFANYIAVPGAVSAVVAVPNLKCKTASAPGSSMYVGVGIQSVNSYARLYLACTAKRVAQYYPSLDVNGTIKNVPGHMARAGDKVEFAVSQSDSQVTITVIDLTHRFSVTTNGSGSGTSEGVLAGDFPVSGTTAPVPNFGKLTFSNALINGYPFGLAGSGLQTDNLAVNSSGPVQIKTVYSPATKEAFTTMFEHS